MLLSITNLSVFFIICTELFLILFQYMGSPYKRSIRLLGYYPSHIIWMSYLITLYCELFVCDEINWLIDWYCSYFTLLLALTITLFPTWITWHPTHLRSAVFSLYLFLTLTWPTHRYALVLWRGRSLPGKYCIFSWMLTNSYLPILIQLSGHNRDFGLEDA